MIPQVTLDKDWAGLTAVVVGNGNSMLKLGDTLRRIKSEDTFRRMKSPPWKTLIANSGYEFFPDADVLMCSDRNWLPLHPDLSAFKGTQIIVTRPEAVRQIDPRMVHVRRGYIEQMRPNPFKDPGTLAEGHNSTSTNISQAILRGASRILLLGVDLTTGPGHRRSAYNAAPDDVGRALVRYERQVKHLSMQAAAISRYFPRVEVLNCSPRSGLVCYPYANMEELLCSES